jgi:hypothetical protein
MKIELGTAALPALARIFRSRDEGKSLLKVEGKAFRVGGMNVSPSVSTVF